MNKLVILDLDGVLIDSRELHYYALNDALLNIGAEYVISRDEHLSTYDGLSTTKKLKMLTESKGLDPKFHNQVWKDKQSATIALINNFKVNESLISLIKNIKDRGYRLAVASNAIRETVKLCLIRIGIIEYVDYVMSNEDVLRTKPYPEMYWRCMMALGALPKNTIIIEDSHIGRQGAIDSGAHLLPVENSHDFNTDYTLQRIFDMMEQIEGKSDKSLPWRDSKLNIVIPMAGAGSRFAQAGYTFPKPLIEVNGKPMIKVVVDNLNIEANYIFIVQKEHYVKYNLKYLLDLIAPGCTIIQVDGVTEGSACTALLAKDYIDNDNPMVMANSDQYIEWNSNECMYSFYADNIDGGILTFEACFGYRTLVDTLEYGKIPIGKIVNKKLNCNILSYNENTRVFEYCKVLDYVKLNGSGFDWKTISVGGQNNIKVTSDHEFLTNNGWIGLSDIGENSILSNECVMNDVQYDVFIGTMLGDASISTANGKVNSGLKFSHSSKQSTWALTKLKMFDTLGTSFDEKSYTKYGTISCRVKVNTQFKNERLRWYTPKKEVPYDIVLSPYTIATWYMDDGTLIKASTDTARLSTDGFSDASIDILRTKLSDLGVQTYITTSYNKPRICVRASSSDIFYGIIADYVIPDMSYKLPEKFRCRCSYDKWEVENVKKFLYKKVNVDDLKINSADNKYAFCLKTENGNFTVSGLVAHNCHPKWSYAKIGDDGFVQGIAEKKVISNLATVGIYFWKKGSDYVKYAEQMIIKDIRVNGEFYVAPVFNEAILDGKKIRVKNIEKMFGIGTPEDLDYFLQHNK